MSRIATDTLLGNTAIYEKLSTDITLWCVPVGMRRSGDSARPHFSRQNISYPSYRTSYRCRAGEASVKCRHHIQPLYPKTYPTAFQTTLSASKASVRFPEESRLYPFSSLPHCRLDAQRRLCTLGLVLDAQRARDSQCIQSSACRLVQCHRSFRSVHRE